MEGAGTLGNGSARAHQGQVGAGLGKGEKGMSLAGRVQELMEGAGTLGNGSARAHACVRTQCTQ